MTSVAEIDKELQELVSTGKIVIYENLPTREEADAIDPADVSRRMQYWLQQFGYASPMQVYNTLKGRFSDLIIQFGQDKKIVYLTHKTDTGVSAATDISFHHLGYSIRNLTGLNMKVPDDQQGSGIGTGILYNLVQFMLRCYPDTKDLKISTAASEIGAYTWAKFGFVPNDHEWESYLGHVRAEMKARLDKINHENNPLFGERDRAELEELILRRPDPKTIWKIADKEERIIDPEKGDNITIGQYLLRDYYWDGTLNLRDPEARERFNQYVGRIGLEPIQINRSNAL